MSESLPPATRAARPGRGRAALAAAALTLAGLLLSWTFSWHSDGVHHDDDLTHFQMARWSRAYPQYLLHDWGRPGFTVLYAIPAQFGWFAARAFSGLLTAATAWLAFLIARRLEARAAWTAPALVWLQPYAFTLSTTTLTETPLAFYLALAFWLLLGGRFRASAAVLSLTAVTRHESAMFLLLWLAAYRRTGRPWREVAWLAWAPALHNLLSLILTLDLPALGFFRPHGSDEYGHGGWLTMLERWEMAAGVGAIVLATGGAVDVIRREHGKLWVGCGAAYLVAHAVFFRFGLFASGGYERFLVPLAPVVAVCAAASFPSGGAAPSLRSLLARHLAPAAAILLLGCATCLEIEPLSYVARSLERAQLDRLLLALFGGLLALSAVDLGAALLRRSLGWRWMPPWLTAAALLACLAQPWAMAMLPPPTQLCRPLRLGERELAFAAALAWLRDGEYSDRPRHFASPWFDHFLDRSVPPREEGSAHRLDLVAAGELLLWDSREFASPRHGAPLDVLRARGDFVELWRSECKEGGVPCCMIFERRPRPR